MSFEINEALISNLCTALQKTDDTAYSNVTHDEFGASILDQSGAPMQGYFPRGGPFGAIVAISNKNGDLENIGTPRGNNVIGSGIASRHAEDQALSEDNYRTLITRLVDYAGKGEDPTVWMISSGQSCTTCHTKQEIAARHLIHLGLIKPGHFATLYGATYDETFDIAQFYDAQYADALIFAADYPQHADNLIQHAQVVLADAPFEVQKLLTQASEPTAVVVRNQSIYAVGKDQRSPFDPYATAEVNAVRAACVRNKENNIYSWNIDGELYTTTQEVGPLLYAEAGWTKISKILSVEMPTELREKQFLTQEAISISNRAFLEVVAQGYQSPEAAIRVFRHRGFVNRAQPMWAKVLEANQEILYNGAAVSDAVLAMRDTYTRFRFAACDITDHVGPKDLITSPEPLKCLHGHIHS